MSISSLSREHVLLSNGEVSLISAEDFERVNKFKWYQSGTYAYSTKLKGSCSLHRFIMNLRVDDKECVDHINGNTLDNRRCNLRLATDSQNIQNSKKRALHAKIPTSSKFKGVSLDKRNNKWLAYIRKKFLGYYSCEELAAIAYNKAAVLEFGEFANLNKIYLGVGL